MFFASHYSNILHTYYPEFTKNRKINHYYLTIVKKRYQCNPSNFTIYEFLFSNDHIMNLSTYLVDSSHRIITSSVSVVLSRCFMILTSTRCYSKTLCYFLPAQAWAMNPLYVMFDGGKAATWPRFHMHLHFVKDNIVWWHVSLAPEE